MKSKRKIFIFIMVILSLILVACVKEEAKEYVRLEVASEPSKIVYDEGESFDAIGAKFNAVYKIGEVESKVDVTSKVKFDKTILNAGDTKVVASYKEGDVTRTVDISITVNALYKDYLRLEMVTQPSKVTYIEGEMFDPVGAKFEAVYNTNAGEIKEDVTSKVTFDKTTLNLGDTKVVASYKEGEITQTVDVAVTVNPIAELIGDGLVLKKPTTGLVITTSSTKGDATSYWFTEYKTNALYIKVIVEDGSLDKGTSVYNGDGIVVSVFGCVRQEGLADGTLLINASITDIKVQKAMNGSFENFTEHGVERVFKKVSFGGKYVEGYQIELTIPFTSAGITDTAVFYPGLYNNDGAIAKTNYYNEFNTNSNKTNTYAHITADNTYARHPWEQIGYVFGNYGKLTAVSTWNLVHDDGTAEAYVELTAVEAGTDNNLYVHKTQASEVYMKASFSAAAVHNGEKWGKLGITVTSLDGKNGLFYFIDAAGDGTNMTGNRVCVVKRVNGEWQWPEQQLHVLSNPDVYQNGQFTELSIYRDGAIFEFFVNGTSVGVKGGFPGLIDNEGLLGLATFNITMTAKQYLVTDIEEDLAPFRHEPTSITNLFIGDSYVDKAFWQDFDVQFGTESVNVGVGGTKVGDWIDDLPSYVKLYNPQNIIVHIGVNDINDGGTTGQQTYTRIEELFTLMRQLYPEVNIYYISIEPNNFMPTNNPQYQVVNNSIKAKTESYIHFIDTAALLGEVAGTPVAHYFLPDGLHLNQDGYGLWNKAIKQALGLDYVVSQYSLGDTGAYAKSGGWQYHDGFVENIGGWEQQIYFDGAQGTTYGAKVEVSALEIFNGDQYPKFGFANKAKSKTTLFFFDVMTTYNGWGNYVTRQTGSDWNWNGIGFRQFINLGATSYHNNFKSIEFIRLGDSYYFICDGMVVQYAEGLFGTEETALSIMVFNMKIQLREAKVYTEIELQTRIAELKIAVKKGSKIDGDISDWDPAVLQNPTYIYGSDGRIITYYMYMEDDGLYIAAVGLHGTAPINNHHEWWNNTNIEFKLGNGNQRFAAASGAFSRREGDTNGPRGVGFAAWKHTQEESLKYRSVVELMIPWSMIDEHQYSDPHVLLGIAWKQPTEEGSIWGGGDFWYVPEADPGMRNIKVTKIGVKGATALTMDGNLSDWDTTLITNAKVRVDGERTFTVQAYVGVDGIYGFTKVVCTNPLNINTAHRAGDWWQNPNNEIWINDQHARIMMYGGEVRATGRIQDVGATFDETTNTLIIEYFVPFHALGGQPSSVVFRIGTNSINGGWFMPIDPNTSITENGIQ